MVDFTCLNIEDSIGFDWDDGNILKNEKKHGINWQSIEEIFSNKPLLVLKDEKHSIDECRCFALGHANNMQKLFIVFTLRDAKIRVISARLMNKKERIIYGNL